LVLPRHVGVYCAFAPNWFRRLPCGTCLKQNLAENFRKKNLWNVHCSALYPYHLCTSGRYSCHTILHLDIHGCIISINRFYWGAVELDDCLFPFHGFSLRGRECFGRQNYVKSLVLSILLILAVLPVSPSLHPAHASSTT